MMGFWIFMVMMDLMIPLIMIVFGKVFLKNPPKEINLIYGYRTGRSTYEVARRTPEATVIIIRFGIVLACKLQI